VSIGAGPSQLVFSDIARGGYGEETITVSTSGSDELVITFSADGDASSWITVKPSSSFKLPASGRSEATVAVNVPDDTQDGVYAAKIRVRAEPTQEVTEGAGVSVGAAVVIGVEVHVTGEGSGVYEVSEATVSEVEAGKPIYVNTVLENTWNVKVKPKLAVEVYDEEGTKIAEATYLATDLMPYSKGDAVVELDSSGLAEGEYNVLVGHFNQTGSQEKIEWDFNESLKILPRGSLTASGTLLNMVLDKTSAKPGDVVKVNALFKNTGPFPVKAKLEGEVTRDYQLAARITSDETEVKPKETVILNSFFTPKEAGTYEVECHVKFEDGKTDSVSEILTVKGGNTLIYGVAAVAVIALLYIKKKSGGKKSAFLNK